MIICCGPRSIVTEDDGVDHTSHISNSTYNTRNDSILSRVDMRYESIICAVASFEEQCHDRNKAKHGGFVMRIELANDDQEHASKNASDVDESFLQPQVLVVLVDDVSADATERTSHEVKKTEHGSPST